MSRRIILVDLDAFFVSVEQVVDPKLKGKPVVVGGKPDRRGVVAAASYEARTFGLRSGMPLVTAQRLCPQAVFIEGNFHRYHEASQSFMAILADYSPFLEPMSLDEAYLDATGFESLHGSIRNMAVSIKKRVHGELGLPASVGIAGGKVVAKVACERSKPDGLLEVPEGEERAFLAPLPLLELPGIGQKTERVLRGFNVRTIGELSDIAVGLLKSRLGVYGEYLHRLASGIDTSQVEPPAAAKSISKETTFAEDTRDRAFLEATLRYLSERVGARLRRRGRQARCVILKLRNADFQTITRRRTLAWPADTDQVIFDTGLELLKRELSRERQPIRLLGIGVSGFAETGRQLGMFDDAGRQDKLNRAVDRIRQKYGFTAIQTGRTLKLKDLFPSG